MKKNFFVLLFCLTPLFAGDPACEPPPLPIGMSGTYLRVFPARLRDPEFEGEHLSYFQTNAAYAYTHACNPYCGWIFGAGYVGTELDWKENPFFDEKFFSYVNFNLGGYTKATPDWTWVLTGTMFMDTAVLDLRNYALYQVVLHGKYFFSPCVAFDVGFLIEAGLKRGKAWPILGIEYDPTDRFSLHLVYPFDISVSYDIFPMLTIAGSLRFLRDRHRTLEINPLPMGIYEYETTGYECDLTFSPFENLAITAFAGSTFNGRIKITNQNNHHPSFIKFTGSFYSGAAALLAF